MSSSSFASPTLSSSFVQSWQSPSNRNQQPYNRSHQRQQRQQYSLPELLAVRQMTGKATPSRVGPLTLRGVPLDVVASRSAWNSRRLQNMILAVGPSTPASLLLTCPDCGAIPYDGSSSSYSGEEEDDDDEEEDEESTHSQAEEEEPGQNQDDGSDRGGGLAGNGADEEEQTRRSAWLRSSNRQESSDVSSEMEDANDENDDSGNVNIGRDDSRYSHRMGLEPANLAALRPVPSMRHGGCINTAAWLDCGWKMALPGGTSRDTVTTEECPTQVITSGDDLLVKVWDVSQAMGMTTPLAGSCATLCPFSSPENQLDESLIKDKWQRYYQQTNSDDMAGAVLPLATIATGHRNNVFHVAPLRGQPGKVATCAADGFLRLADLETGQSRVVISPEFGNNHSLRSAMCFSHQFLSQNTGLLCSERGLRRFDLRISPREQETRSLLPGLRSCKACAIWSSSKSSTATEEGDSAYVFAGGSSPEVSLWDMRMTDAASNKIIQKYTPRNLSDNRNVSVSGIDISKDGQELLVSYESDQIYTFPIFPSLAGSACPAMDDIRQLCDRPTKVLNELACYGAHLNRYTFLKNAKYAGPRDEYICTGSDSGHAWIYEKKNGSVVALLNADHSTCNGVIPHPSLPFFITYGIDSTAKLWRGTPPVDETVDDSAMGRRSQYQMQKYDMSPCVENWSDVQKILSRLDSDEIIDSIDYVLPDEIPASRDISRGNFGFLSVRGSTRRSRIGNDLHKLPSLLVRNYFETMRGLFEDMAPVESGARHLRHRVSLIRLRHQADRLGLYWNPSLPWKFGIPDEAVTDGKCFHPADLVPDYPSDWIPYDPETSQSPRNFEQYFNLNDYQAFYADHYPCLEMDEPSPAAFVLDGQECRRRRDEVADCSQTSGEESPDSDRDSDSVHEVLIKTMELLKDGGNLSLQEGALDLAARRYDKALCYGSVASMTFPSKGILFAHDRTYVVINSGGFPFLKWNELAQLVIRTRLNLSLIFLKPHFSKPQEAARQALNALHDLEPFCAQKGKIMKGEKLDKVHRESEHEETYLEAKALQAKAYFRLGSAQSELGEILDAILSYECSVNASEQAQAKPDRLVLRRLSEAKRESRLARKRERTKYEAGFAGVVSPDNTKSGRANDGNGS